MGRIEVVIPDVGEACEPGSMGTIFLAPDQVRGDNNCETITGKMGPLGLLFVFGPLMLSSFQIYQGG